MIGDISTLSEKEQEELAKKRSYFETAEPVTPLEIVSRDDWGAAPPTSKEPICAPLQWALILDTGGESCTNKEQCVSRVKELQTYYMEEKGLPDIPWNFLIGGDGVVYEGRGWLAKPSKLVPETQHLDGESVDMAYIGDFRETEPSMVMTLTATSLFRLGSLKGVLAINYDMYSEIMADFVEKKPEPPKVNP